MFGNTYQIREKKEGKLYYAPDTFQLCTVIWFRQPSKLQNHDVQTIATKATDMMEVYRVVLHRFSQDAKHLHTVNKQTGTLSSNYLRAQQSHSQGQIRENVDMSSKKSKPFTRACSRKC